MIRHDAQREIGELVAAVAATAQPFAHLDETVQDVGIEVRAHALHDGGHALEAQARVDVLLLEGNHRAVFLTVELREDEVPVLEEAVAIATGLAVGAAAPDILSLIVVELRARTAGTGGASGPEVVVLSQAGDVVLGNAQRTPHVVGLVVLGKDGKVQAVERQLKLLGDELKGPSASLLLGDAAKREVAEHLEERQVTAVLADAIDVIGADALLAGDRADLLHGLLALVVLLKLVHAGVGKQQRRIVGDEGRRRIELKTALLKEVEELRANLGRSH